jgi:isopenicillin-N epimerase
MDAVRTAGNLEGGARSAIAAFGHALRAQWALDPDILYLNHGTVGAPPRRVLEAQQRIRDEIERQPSHFLLRELSEIAIGDRPLPKPRLRAAADQVAEFLGARGDDLVFVDNVTSGINAVLRSFPWQAGDEVLITDLVYGAIGYAAQHFTSERGAHVRQIALPWPPSPEGFVAAFTQALGPRTRMVIVDHVSSESALVFPVAEIAAACRARGVAVLVDGAHAPGAISFSIPALGVDWYAANLHKWGHTPRSLGILWAPPERQPGLHPPVISWGLGRGFTTEFDCVGTRDPSAALAAPEAIAFLRALGVEAAQRYMHDLVLASARMLAARWGTRFDAPESMIGTMATVPLPERAGSTPEAALALRDALLDEDRIEVQLHAHRGGLWVRIGAQVYNEASDFERLGEAVAARL